MRNEYGPHVRARWCAGLLLAAYGLVMSSAWAGGPDRLLDGFETLEAWTADASDGVKATAVSTTGVHGRALRLDFDLGKSAGYAFVRRELPLDLPENFELSFLLRAKAPINNFEVKLTDASGENVWWFERRISSSPASGVASRSRSGRSRSPGGRPQDRSLRRIDSLEFVVGAGRGGGSGSIEIDDLRFRELPPPPTRFPPLSATASSSLSGAEASAAVDGDPRTSWRSDPKAGDAQSLNVDLGMLREFGGLELHWQDGARPRRYDVRDVQRRSCLAGAAAGDERQGRQGCVASAGGGGALHQDQSSRRRRS